VDFYFELDARQRPFGSVENGHDKLCDVLCELFFYARCGYHGNSCFSQSPRNVLMMPQQFLNLLSLGHITNSRAPNGCDTWRARARGRRLFSDAPATQALRHFHSTHRIKELLHPTSTINIHTCTLIPLTHLHLIASARARRTLCTTAAVSQTTTHLQTETRRPCRLCSCRRRRYRDATTICSHAAALADDAA
jgi:hypothetical protein